MYRSLLVPLDGSTFAEQALPLATEICTRSGAALHVVLVHDSLAAVPRYGEPALLDPLTELASRQQEEQYLAAVARPIIASGVTVLTRLLQGPVAHSLVDYVRTNAIELAVLTTHGRGMFSRFWIGSVADRLVRQLEVPMLVLRPRAARGTPSAAHLRRILIPLDGSTLAEAVLDPAVRFGELLDAGFTLYRAVMQSSPVQLPYPAVMIFPEPVELASVVREQATQYLDAVARKLRERGLAIGTAVEMTGDPVSAITTFAEREGVDLIALATHGYGGATRFLLGSVADKLLRSSTVPLFVWRPGARTDAAGAESLRGGVLAST